MANLVIAQVLLTFVLGLWLAAKLHDSPLIKFFGRNDWFVGSFLALVGYMNFLSYSLDYLRNLNIVLIVVGVLLILVSIADVAQR